MRRVAPKRTVVVLAILCLLISVGRAGAENPPGAAVPVPRIERANGGIPYNLRVDTTRDLVLDGFDFGTGSREVATRALEFVDSKKGTRPSPSAPGGDADLDRRNATRLSDDADARWSERRITVPAATLGLIAPGRTGKLLFRNLTSAGTLSEGARLLAPNITVVADVRIPAIDRLNGIPVRSGGPELPLAVDADLELDGFFFPKDPEEPGDLYLLARQGSIEIRLLDGRSPDWGREHGKARVAADRLRALGADARWELVFVDTGDPARSQFARYGARPVPVRTLRP